MARALLCKSAMKMFLTLVVVVGSVGAVLKYREAQKPAAPVKEAGKRETAAPARHFPKQALDRAAEVKRQVADEREARETN